MSSRKKDRPVRLVLWLPLIFVLLGLLCLSSCPRTRQTVSRSITSCRGGKPGDPSLVLVTAYCSCGVCCSWRPRYWFFGEPVISAGPRKGRPKDVGRTASGRLATHGTVAADTKVFPMGTRLEIPGYGVGRVEDTGGAIRGRHIDVWFPTHEEALDWGARWLPVRPLKSKNP